MDTFRRCGILLSSVLSILLVVIDRSLTTFLLALVTIIFMFVIMACMNKDEDMDAYMKCIKSYSHLSISMYYKEFKNMDTPFGRAWMGNIELIKGRCIIWGPDTCGQYMYAYKNSIGNKLYICRSDAEEFINVSENNVQSLKYKHENHRRRLYYKLISSSILDEIAEKFQKYTDTGKVEFIFGYKLGSIYGFSDDFSNADNNLMIYDEYGKPVYRCSVLSYDNSFSVKDYNTGAEKFKVVKHSLRTIEHYKFYNSGEEYASYDKGFNFIKDKFSIGTEDGILLIKNINEDFGASYIVRLGGKIIGAITDNLEAVFKDIIFDDYIIYVTEDKYVPLMAGLAAVTAVEMKPEEYKDELYV